VRSAALPQRVTAPGATLELLVLASDGGGCAGVDIASGALVRAVYPERTSGRLAPFDLVVAPLGDLGEPDPALPEAVELGRLPRLVGHLGARRAERWLRPLLHPQGEPLLGFMGPAVQFWELTGERPSMAVVEPRGGARVVRRPDGALRCRFLWRTLVVDLPLRAGPLPVARRLLVALTPPRQGHCHKVVAALL